MANTHETLESLFIDTANAIRAKTGGTADIVADEFPQAIEAIPSGGAIQATGQFTILSITAPPTITHNLGTKKICGIIYPAEELVGTQGYQAFYAEFFNIADTLSTSSFSYDFSSYNTKPDNVGTVVFPNNEQRIGALHFTPWNTQSGWSTSTANGSTGIKYSECVFTENTFTINRNFQAGTYKYIIWSVEQ